MAFTMLSMTSAMDEHTLILIAIVLETLSKINFIVSDVVVDISFHPGQPSQPPPTETAPSTQPPSTETAPTIPQ